MDRKARHLGDEDTPDDYPGHYKTHDRWGIGVVGIGYQEGNNNDGSWEWIMWELIEDWCLGCVVFHVRNGSTDDA